MEAVEVKERDELMRDAEVNICIEKDRVTYV